MRLSPDDLRSVAQFLDVLTEATKATGVQASGHNRSELTTGETVLTYQWDDATGRYVIEQDES